MKLKRKWSTRARNNFKNILEYLLQEWSEKEALGFAEKLDKILFIIQKHPTAFPESKKGHRRAVISRQITLFYRVDGSKLMIITLFDTRQHPGKLKI